MRLIDADNLIEECYKDGAYGYVDALQIAIAPTIDAVPVKHGRWIHTDYALHWTAKDECSECTYHACDRNDLSYYNYCPNCGADMRGDENGC